MLLWWISLQYYYLSLPHINIPRPRRRASDYNRRHIHFTSWWWHKTTPTQSEIHASSSQLRSPPIVETRRLTKTDPTIMPIQEYRRQRRRWQYCCPTLGGCCLILTVILSYIQLFMRLPSSIVPTTTTNNVRRLDDNDHPTTMNSIKVVTTSTQSLLSPIDMFVAISNMLPNHRGTCPDHLGLQYPPEWFQLREMKLCFNQLKYEADNGRCIIYNFGVGKSDPFLQYMSLPNSPLKACTVYAFDPFIEPNEVTFQFGPNIQYYQIGLWNGYSNRVGIGKHGKGTLMSLIEIQQMLGHHNNNNNNHDDHVRITLLRSDCEGCEYGWVQHAMVDDPTIFDRIDQMFIEVHTVPIQFMPSIELPWHSNGLPPNDVLVPVYTMLTQHFRVLDATINHGGPKDRNRIPHSLHSAGVLKYPCCREFNLIHKSLIPTTTPSAAEGAVEEAEYHDNPYNSTTSDDMEVIVDDSVVGRKVTKSMDVLFCSQHRNTIDSRNNTNINGQHHQNDEDDTYRDLFHGRHQTCHNGTAPRCFGPTHNKYDTTVDDVLLVSTTTTSCYCPEILDRDVLSNSCLVYFFGNFNDPNDLNMVLTLAELHPQCGIQAFDPRWDGPTTHDIITNPTVETTVGRSSSLFVSLKNIPPQSPRNVFWNRWGVYGGSGPRVAVRTTRRNGTGTTTTDKNDDDDVVVCGDLYTFGEMMAAWRGKDQRYVDTTISHRPPNKLSLVRIDWTMVSPCTWRREIAKEATLWWGSYDGIKSVQQLM